MSVQDLKELFYGTFGEKVERTLKLPLAGSHREYYRLIGGGKVCIGVISPDPLETKAFLEFTRHFSDRGLNVPRLFADDPGGGIYLLEDLGDQSLKEEVDRSRKEGEYPDRILPLYRSALRHLLRFQTEGHEALDYSICVPRQEFDRQSVLWDLNHFKYFFLKLLAIPFDEQALEDDFQSFASALSGAGTDYFMYRDFQSRNIMIREDDLFFIDYQGGRRGPLQYDVASLLFESRVDLSPELRQELLEDYLGLLTRKTGLPAEEFMQHYYNFVLIRILQVLGAYGIRGIVENKALFLQSIPFAIRNLEWLRDQAALPGGLPELFSCLDRICGLDEWKINEAPGELTVRVNSFSYKKGLPKDKSGNGGGFVFDCRALPNPGREEKYRRFTGRDREVIDFLEGKAEVKEFLGRTFDLVERSVREYQSRGFMHLMVSFGCTGGQHRSVYCAERMNEFISGQLNTRTRLYHKELKKEDWNGKQDDV